MDPLLVLLVKRWVAPVAAVIAAACLAFVAFLLSAFGPFSLLAGIAGGLRALRSIRNAPVTLLPLRAHGPLFLGAARWMTAVDVVMLLVAGPSNFLGSLMFFTAPAIVLLSCSLVLSLYAFPALRERVAPAASLL